jgi:DNA-binding beta-propeller fold protein YncE
MIHGETVPTLRPYILATAIVAVAVACGGGDVKSQAQSSLPALTATAAFLRSPAVSEITVIPTEELAAWGTDTRTLAFASPNGLAIDADGFIYTTEFQGSRVRKFNPSGELLMEWGTSGSSDGMFQSPTGIFIGPEGNVYVAESGNDSVQKFTADGDWIATIGSLGARDGQFQSAMVLVISDSGEIFVSIGATVVSTCSTWMEIRSERSQARVRIPANFPIPPASRLAPMGISG